jgi:hypothetical protein
MTQWAPVLKGLATYIPGLYTVMSRRKTSSSGDAAYYYDLWIKHLTLLWASGMRAMPKSVAEFGPGQSLGLGIAALLSGVAHYYALDVVLYESPDKSLAMLDAMVAMFHRRAGLSRIHTPSFDQHLDANRFPSHILTDERLAESLAPERIALIRAALMQRIDKDSDVSVQYIAPWNDNKAVTHNSIDVIVSHTVMEYVSDLEDMYHTCAQWLCDDGWMSHQIDLTSHDITQAWNGNWAYSNSLWKMAAGKRPYFLNRQPCSQHINAINQTGFDIRCAIQNQRTDGLARHQLSKTWQGLSDDDVQCAGLFVQAQKRPNPPQDH